MATVRFARRAATDTKRFTVPCPAALVLEPMPRAAVLVSNLLATLGAFQ